MDSGVLIYVAFKMLRRKLCFSPLINYKVAHRLNANKKKKKKEIQGKAKKQKEIKDPGANSTFIFALLTHFVSSITIQGSALEAVPIVASNSKIVTQESFLFAEMLFCSVRL